MKLLKEIKENNQDFEWYASMDCIISAVYERLKFHGIKKPRFMDIGSGNGKVLHSIEDLYKADRKDEYDSYKVNKYAIEKSEILLNELDPSVFIVGTEFWQQTFVDKQMDVLYSNPPFSEYSAWAEKIIREGNAQKIYLVLPERWKNQEIILKTIESRNAVYEVIGTFDFMNAEDRTARAKADLIEIDLCAAIYKGRTYRNRDMSVDPFHLWFRNNFSINATKKDPYYWDNGPSREKLDKLALDKNYVQKIVDFYNHDLDRLVKNYQKLQSIDRELLDELKVSLDSIEEKFRLKIESLKDTYWKSLFDNMDSITSRLTSETRKMMLDKLYKNVSIDFTESNIYALIIWTIKNANKYFDEQLVSVFQSLSASENVTNFKSNHRLIKDGWRYGRGSWHYDEKPTHYKLDYRICIHHYKALDYDYNGRIRGLDRSAADKIDDICTIGHNLGFNIDWLSNSKEWERGKKVTFRYADDGKEYEFMTVRVFDNGNIHVKLAQKFQAKLNIEAARLLKWVKSAGEASNEMDIDIETAEEVFGSNFIFTASNTKALPFLQRGAA